MCPEYRGFARNAFAVALTAFAFAVPAVPVSAAAPTVDAVKFLSSPQSGDTYGVGERITVEVEWSESVLVTGSPRLALTVGSNTRYAEYAGGANPRFRYTVGSRVRDLNGVSVAAGALELNGGAIRSESTNENADIGLGSHAITDDSSHKVDGSIAVAAIVTAVRITTRPSGGRAYFRTGERIRVEVRFGKPVSASSIVRPRLALSIGAATRQVSAAASSGFSEFLTFDYTVQSGDYDPDGFSIAAGALTLGRVVDRGARAANLNLGRHAISSAAGYRVNNAPPSFGSATVANRKFDTDTPIAPLVLPEATGEGTLSYTLTPSTMPQGLTWTSATRTISGTPTAVTAARTYTWKATDSEDETATLTFTIAVAEIPSFGSAAGPALRYEVNQPIASFSLPAAAGGDGALTYALGTTPALPEGLSYTPPTGTATGGVIAGTPTEAKAERTYTLTATDTDGDAATFTFTISVVNHPVVSEVRIMDWSTNGVYYSGEEIRIFVGFSSSITVWGNTDLAIVIGGQTRRAGRHSFNTTGLWYSYTVQDSDFDTDGISIPADAHRLTSGVIQRTGTGQSVDMAIGGLAITDAPDHKVGSPRFATGASVPAQSYTQRTLIDSLTLPSATGATPLTYALGATPALPAGLTYTAPTSGNSHGGVIAGTPTAALAQTTYTFTATDTNGRSDSLTFTITVDGIPTFGDATVANQSWVQRRRIAAFTLPAAVGGDGVLTYALSPSLPGGVTRDAATHVVSGAPSTSQTATTYTWAATDADGDKAELAFTIEVEGVPAVTLATADSAIAENGGTTTVTATLSHAWGQAMTVTVTPVAGSYTVGQDATIAIAAGSTANASDSVTITAVNDDLDNVGDRSVTVSGTAGSARGAGSVTGAPLTLTDDEATPTATLVLSPASIAEGAWATVAATLDRASSEAVTLTVSAAAGANASDGDFTLSSTRTLAIAAGSTSSSGTVTITATRDTSDSPDKEVTVSASVSGSSGIAAPASRTLTITDDGPPTVTLALADSSISENGGTTTVSATLTSAWTSEIVVTVNGLAGAYAVGADTTIAIPAGQTQNSSDTVTVTAVDNATDEPDRSVTVSATAEYLAPGSLTRSVGVSGAVLTLEDDDAAPYVTVQPSTLRISENGGTADLSATASHPSSAVTKVTISVAPSSRAPAGDYVLSRNRVLTIAAGATTSTGTVTVAAVDNDRDEPDRWVVLRGTPQNSQGTSQYAGLSLAIDDDEAAPAVTLAVADGAVDEDGGTTTVTATLSHASSEDTTITVTALDGAYTVGTDATIVIAAGATSNASDTAAITAVDDDVDNVGNRTVTVTATADNSHDIGTVTGAALTLTDDEETPAVTLALSEPDTSKPDTIAESGSGNASTVTATLSGPSSEAVTLTVAAAPGANTVEGDFTLSSAKTLTIAAGATASAGTVTVTAVDDTKDAPDKSVTVSAVVSGSSGVAAPADATLTITDDDDPPAVSISSPSVSEGAAGTTATLRFEVTLGTASGRQVTVDYAESATGRTATPGTDYTALASGTLTIAAGDTSGVVAVTVVGDGTDEPDEQVKVVLSGPVNATLGTATGTGTITDDDAAPAVTLAVADGAVDEDGGTTTVTATLSHASSEDTTITVTALDGAYTVGTDATIVIAAGATSNASDTAAITAVDDGVDNVGNRTVTVTATAVNSHDIGTVTGASLTLTDDEETPAVTLALSEPDTSKPDTIAESGSGNASTVTATLSGTSSEAVTLTVAAAPGANAVAGDFTLSPAKTLTIAAGSTASTGAVTVTAVDDTKDAPDKEVTVTATVSGTSGVAAPSSMTLTITDDDDAPGLSISSPSVDEGDSGTVSLEFTVSLGAASGRQVTVGYADAGTGTATSGTDYTAISAGTLTFAAGETAKTLTVLVTGDTTDEPDETVVVSLSGAVNAVIGTASGTGTITDDDATPTVTLALSEPDASKPDTVNESGAGNSSTVTATLSGRSSAEVILTVAATAGANAEAGDFVLSSAKTLTIAAGATASTGTVTVTAVDDTKDAPDKEVTVSGTVSGTSGVAAPSSVTLTITDDDDAPGLSISSPSVDEGDSGTVSLEFTVSLGAASGRQVTVGYADAGTGTATSGTDYTAISAGTLTFAAGETAKTLTVSVTGDTTDEPDETVVVSLSGAANAAISTASGTGTITDDDATPTVTLALSEPDASKPDTVNESGAGNSSTVTATLSGRSSAEVILTVAATAGANAEAGDFTLSSAKTLTIASGSTASAGTVTVTAVDDTKDAPDKEVTVTATVSGTSGAAAPSSVTLTITDDDDAPGLSISSPRVDEGDSGSVSLEFTVSLGAASGRQVTVGYADAGTGTATSGTDYTAISAGTLTFAAGETSRTVTVSVTGDTTDEPDETVVVSLSGAANAVIGTASGTGTITDDDATPTVTLALSEPDASKPDTVNESGAGNSSTVTATLSGRSSAEVILTVAATAGANAEAGDFTLSPAKTLTIAAGSTASTGAVTVTAVDDTKDAPDKSVTVTAVVSGSSGVAAPSSVTLTITDDDDAPAVTLAVVDSSISENGGSTTVTAALSHPSSADTAITVTASAGTGAVATDFTQTGATLTVAAGATRSTGTVTVTAVDDTTDAPDKEVTISGSAVNAQGVGAVTGTTLTITDDEGLPTVGLVVLPSSISESGGVSTVTATLSGASSEAVTVTVGASPVTSTGAMSGDFTLSTANTLTIAAGSTTSTGAVTVTAVDNAADAPDKAVTVSGTAAGGNGVAAPSDMTLVLTDDDAAPEVLLSVASSSIPEKGGSTTVSATLTHPSSAATTVTVTPVANAYTVASGSDAVIVIAAGSTASATDTATITAVDNAVDAADSDVTVMGTAANTRATAESETMTVTGASLTITDDDTAGLVVSPSTSASSRLRTTEDGGTAAFEVKLGSEPTGDVVLGVASSDPAEGTVSASSLTFTATTWSTAQTVTLTGVDDAPANPVDGDRSYTVTLTVNTMSTADPTYDALSAITVYAVNADNEYGLDVGSVTGQATEAGGQATFTVALLTRPSAAVTVSVTSLDASEGAASPSSLTFTDSDWNTTQTVTVTGADDAIDDGDVTWNVRLAPSSGDANYDGLSNVDVLVTTTDDDDAPNAALSLNPASVSENGGASVVSATLTHPSSAATTVTVTPVSGFYTVGSDAAIVIAAGETADATDTATIAAVDDDVHQGSGGRSTTVTATLTNSQGAGTVSGATLTLTDDETLPTVTLALSPATIDESGGVSTVTATLSGTSSEAVTVTVGAAAVAPAVSGDFALSSDETLMIAAGSTTSTGVVTVTANGNAVDSPDKSVTVSGTVSGTSGVAAPSSVTLTITDDDDAPGLSISSPRVDEGDSGTVSLEFTVSLGAASGRQVTVGYADAGTGTATSGTDYTAISAGTLTFAAGETAKTLTVTVTGDKTDEPDETVVVSLSGAANAAISTASGTGTITDDDDAPSLSIDSPRVDEGDSGSVSLEFTVSLGAASGRQVTVGYADAGTGTATSGTDYTAISAGTLTFAAGETSRTVTVLVTGDTTDEPDETVVVSLSGAVNAAISTASGTGTITDDDGEPSLSIDSPSVGEGDSGTVSLEFTVSLGAASGRQVTVGYADAGTGTATSGTDYTAISAGTLTFAAGETSRTVTVLVTGDTTDEPDETVVVSLSGSVNAAISTASGTGTITDDDGEPSLSIDSPRVDEGDSGTVSLEFTVSLGAASGRQVTVGYADAGTGTATSGTDYTALGSGTLTFAAGETAKTLTVSVTGDTTDEPDETVVVSLSGSVNAAISTASGTGTITDDDGEPSLSIDSPRVGEGDSGTVSLEFTVSLGAASGRQVTVGYADAGTGTATSGADYTAISAGTLTFAAGETSRTVTVSVTGDTTDEPDETVVVSLSGSVNAAISTASGTGTITDDDGEPSLSIDSPSVTEGNSGSASLEFTVSLGAASGRQVTVGYADAGTGTATSGADYTAISAGTLTFAAGETSRTVTVSVTGDTTDEPDETVVVSLSGSVNAAISTASGTGTITDDDGEPSLSIDSPSVTEGNSGSASLEFTVSLGAASGRQVTVGYADAGTGTATSGADYTAISAGTLTFAAGETAKTLTVSVTGDTTDEPDETVVVSLSGAANAAISTASGTGTITDDDGEPSLSIDSPRVDEGDSGTASLEFTVSLGAASGRQVTVGYADAGTGTATSGTDYTALGSGTLTFAAGETAKTLTVTVTGDETDEPDETVVVSLSGSVNAAISTATGTGTITDDDGEPSLSIDSPRVGEGDSGPVSLEFTVSLSAASGRQVTVGYADAGTGTASSGTDYTALASGTLTFAAGETSKTLTVTVTGDETSEPDETVVVTLSGPANAVLGTASGTGTITDDDGEPSLSIDSPSVTEGDSGSASLEFTVSLSAASGQQVTVGYADAGTGTASSGTDYTALASGTLTFAAGETSKTLTVTVTGDETSEPDETVVVTLSGPANAVLGTASGTGTITDDDGEPSLSIDSPSVTEGDSGSASLEFTVSLSAASGQQVTVGYADAGTGTATSGTDYTALGSGTLTFAAGETARTLTVTVTGDETSEPDETVVVTLSGPANAVLGTASGTGTITDDDGAPSLSIDSPSVGEGDSGSVSLEFTVSLSAASGQQVTVGYADAGTGTATSGTDYTALASGTLTFAAGETGKTLTVTVIGDETSEPDETVVVSLSGSVNAAISTASGTGTITDDDMTPAMGGLSADAGDDQTVAEGVVVTLDGSRSTGPSGRTGLGYAWTQSAGGPVVALAGADTARPSFTAPQVGARTLLTFVLTVTAGGASVSDTVTVTVTARAPEAVKVEVDTVPSFGDAAIAEQVWKQHTPVAAFTLPAAHGGDGPLTYTLSPGLPAGMVKDAGHRISGTPSEPMVRTQYTWTATDADGDEATLAFSITVIEDLIPEFTETVSDQLYWVGTAIDGLELPAASGGDEPLTYILLPGLPAGLTFDATSRVVSGMPSVVMAERVYTLTAMDADGDTAMLSFRVEVAAPVTMSIVDAQAEEGEAVAFMVELSPPPPRPMEVLCMTVPGTATAHGDYVHVSAHRMRIEAGRSAVRVEVATIDDGEVEPEETFMVRLEPEWTVVRGVEATGTILDNDASARARGLKVMLATFGREVATEAVEVVGARFAEGASGPHVTLGGQRVGLDAVGGPTLWGGASGEGRGFGRGVSHQREPRSGRSVTAREVVSDSGFALTFGVPEEEGSGVGSRWTVWGRTGRGEFSGRPRGEVSTQGKVFSGYMGVDTRWSSGLVAGVALSHSEGEMSYERTDTRAEVEARLTSVLPYGRWTMGGGLSVWGLLGAGWGEVEWVDAAGAAHTGLGMRLVAMGWRKALGGMPGMQWALKGDGFAVEMDSDAVPLLPAVRARAQRLRLVLESAMEWSLAGHGRLRTEVELGGRWDGGDAERGYGSEVGGSVEYVDPRLGVELQGRGRYLLGHESAGFRAWGASLGVRFDPGGDGQGVWIGVSPRWGASASGVESLWGSGPSGGDDESSLRMALEAGYRSGDSLEVSVTVEREKTDGASAPIGATIRTRVRW